LVGRSVGGLVGEALKYAALVALIFYTLFAGVAFLLEKSRKEP
jgi:hypothetical protein